MLWFEAPIRSGLYILMLIMCLDYVIKLWDNAINHDVF